MPLITLRQLLDHAAENDYGVPAFNLANMEQGLAILEAARAAGAPAILQMGRMTRSYATDIMLRHIVAALVESYPDIPICVHHDHGNNEASCATALQNGYTSVMMDGSLLEDAKTPASYEYNVAKTRMVVDMAHWMGASVEGEIGCIGAIGEDADGTTEHLTDPDQAVAFVAATKVDALAIAMGTSHGAYKFKRQPDGEILAMDRVEEIHRRLPNTHLVMHGSSSVPQEFQELINKYGGDMPQTWGVPVEEIQRGIRHGVRKVNIDTDNRMAMLAEIRRMLAEHPREIDLRKLFRPAIDAMTKLCRERFEQFGTAGQAAKIAVLPQSAMARRYASGALDPGVAA
ncbi:Fructose-bisphosphate aldolase 1 [Hyphomicrobiales bacterium]|nr:Fructose-bisphosphate aldolase 1 [Hyphomicrobiales bacterium]CAH1694916.1 Fructose-bisphosphate aldolase 1 [Hyphomicrobiales bacterium]